MVSPRQLFLQLLNFLSGHSSAVAHCQLLIGQGKVRTMWLVLRRFLLSLGTVQVGRVEGLRLAFGASVGTTIPSMLPES